MNRLRIKFSAVLLWLTATAVSAQFTPGSQFVGGGFSVGTPIAPKLAESISISLQPEFGRFRSDNVAVGLTATLGYGQTKVSNTRTTNSYSVGIGPFIQRFLPVVDNFGFVLTGRSQVAVTSTTNTTTGSTDVKVTNNNVGLGLSGSPGLFFSISDRWLLLLDLGVYQALTVGYANQKTTSSDTKSSTLNYAVGRTFSLSSSAIRIRYFLP